MYNIYYTRKGMRVSLTDFSKNDAIDYAKELIQEHGMKEVEVFPANCHSTADYEQVVAWWGVGTYMDNVSKRVPELLEKKLM